MFVRMDKYGRIFEKYNLRASREVERQVGCRTASEMSWGEQLCPSVGLWLRAQVDSENQRKWRWDTHCV